MSADRHTRRAAVRRLALGALVLVTGAIPVRAQQDAGTVTLKRVFIDGDFASESFGPVRWFDGGSYTTLESTDSGGASLVRIDAESGRRTVLVPAARLVPAGAREPLDVESYDWSADKRELLIFTNSRRVWRQRTRGDYWVLDLASGRLRQLGGKAAPSTLMFATFSPDGRRVAYVRERNLYVEDVATGTITPLTTDGSATIINGTFDWVYEEEFNDRNGFRWSPDGKWIAYWQLDTKGVRDFLLIDDTDSLYSFTEPVQYPKAGTTNSAARVGVVSASGGATRWIDVPGDPRNNYIARMEWAASSSELVLQHFDRLQHTLDVMLADARTGRARTVLSERDSTWVDVVDDLEWLEGGRAFTWVSERDGWRHLYVVPRQGGSARLVTPGPLDLTNPDAAFGAPLVLGVDSARGWVYFTSTDTAHAGQLSLYRAALDGRSTPLRVTPARDAGTNTYDVAPGARFAIRTHSAFGVPPTVDLVRLPSHDVVRALVENKATRERVAALRRGAVAFLRVPGADGAQLDAWVMKPPGFDSTKRYPILFTVYGEPAAQTVLDGWGGADYLWHLMLTQQGWIVAAIDNRGTPAPRGRAWRHAIYKRIGTLAVADITAGAQALIARPYVDTARVAVWGWSGGGTTTLHLMFRSPQLFRLGMAVAPVTVQRFYDTIYEERYMGLPQESAVAYRESSATTYAEGLRGDLLLVHGSGDDNVHFQNSEALVNVLVRLGKPFTFMDYPNRSHCLCEGMGTTFHLYSLLTRYLEEHLGAAAPHP